MHDETLSLARVDTEWQRSINEYSPESQLKWYGSRNCLAGGDGNPPTENMVRAQLQPLPPFRA